MSGVQIRGVNRRIKLKEKKIVVWKGLGILAGVWNFKKINKRKEEEEEEGKKKKKKEKKVCKGFGILLGVWN